MNAHIKQSSAPGLVGKWASNKEGVHVGDLVAFMSEQRMAAINTFKQTQWRNRYTWSMGPRKSMIDFFLCPEYMMRWQHTAKGGSSSWNMQSDHRAIKLTLPHIDDIRDKGRWTTPKKRELANPSDFGTLAAAAIQARAPTTIKELDHMFAEIAKAMPKRTTGKKHTQDPRIRELVLERKQLPRSPDGRPRFKITVEIRKLIRRDSQKREAAINDAFSKHTTWTKIAQEWRINRTEATPVFTTEGKTTTSDEEAMKAITDHIQGIYAKPKNDAYTNLEQGTRPNGDQPK